MIYTMPSRKSEIGKKKLAQHNKLVHASYSMDTYEYLVYIFMLCSISKEDKAFKEVEIPIELVIGKNRGGRTYELVKAAMQKLQAKIITIEEIISKRQKTFTTLSIFDYATFESGTRVVKAKFDDRTAPYLLDLLPGSFTLSEMKVALAIADYQSFRIYNLLKEHSYKEEAIFIPLQDFIQMLALSNTYKKRPSNISIRVIDKAKKKLAKTEMAFDYTTIFNGKSIQGYEFVILKPSPKLPKSNYNQSTEEGLDHLLKDSKLFKDLIKMGFSDKVTKEILTDHEESHIIKCIKIVREQGRKVKLNNPAGYLLGVLKSAHTCQTEIQFNHSDPNSGQIKQQQERLRNLVEFHKHHFFSSYATRIIQKISHILNEQQLAEFSGIMLKNPRNRKNAPLTAEGKIDVSAVNPTLALMIFEEMGLVNKETEFIDFFYQQTGLKLSKEESLPSGYAIQEINKNRQSPYQAQVHDIITQA